MRPAFLSRQCDPGFDAVRSTLSKMVPKMSALGGAFGLLYIKGQSSIQPIAAIGRFLSEIDADSGDGTQNLDLAGVQLSLAGPVRQV
jgi:hypothetical protein